MKRFFATTTLMLIMVLVGAQNFEWAIGSSGYVNSGRAIATDHSGYVYITGAYEALDLNLGPLTEPYLNTGAEIFVSKLAPNGTPLWIHSAQGTYNDWGLALCRSTEDNNMYWGAGFVSFQLVLDDDTLFKSGQNDIFISKLNEDGERIWLNQYGGSGAINLNGLTSYGTNLIGAGSYNGNGLNFGGSTISAVGSDDAYIVSLDSNGIHQWSKSIGGTGYETFLDAKHDQNGDILLVGIFEGSTFEYDGITFSGTSNAQNSIVLKIDPNGNFIWGKSYSGNDDVILETVNVSSQGNVCGGGYFRADTLVLESDTLYNAGDLNGWMVNLDENGNQLWSESIVSNGISKITDIGIDPKDSLIICGIVDSDSILSPVAVPTIEGTDQFLIHTDQQGNIQWNYIIGGEGNDYSKAITCDTLGNFFYVGEFLSDTLTFEGYQFNTNFGGFEFFVTKIGSVPNLNSTNEMDEHNITIFPNPTNGVIHFTNITQEPLPYSIFDLSGKLVKTGTLSTYNNSINMRLLPPGIYLLITDNQKHNPLYFKIIKR